MIASTVDAASIAVCISVYFVLINSLAASAAIASAPGVPAAISSAVASGEQAGQKFLNELNIITAKT